jgi:hypothetical protein
MRCRCRSRRHVPLLSPRPPSLFFMDPSSLGHYTAIPKPEFALRWHDIDSLDVKVYQYALFASNPTTGRVVYNPQEVWYLG